MTSRPITHLMKQLYARAPLKRPVLEVMRRTVRLPKSVSGHLNFKGTFTVQIDPAHSFKIQHWGYLLENDLFWNGFGKGYEATSLQIWRRLATHSHVILDVGANTGVYTLVACCVSPGATVIALEPVERVFRRLQQNVQLNGFKAQIERVAASDRSESATIYDLPSDHEYTASLDQTMSAETTGVIEYPVDTTPIDDLIDAAGLSRLDLVKIDVEQFEPQVLRGMSKCLSEWRPALIIEILNDRVAALVNDIIEGHGYKAFHIVEGHGLIAGSLRATGPEGRNYLLIQEETAEQAKLRDFIVS